MIAFNHPTKWKKPREHHDVRLIVIHGDAGKSDQGTISWISKPENAAKVSYHYLVGRDGKVHQFVDEAESAWHAGKSSWPNCTVVNTVNPHSIGVAFANDGAEPYRPVQYEAGAELVAGICKRHRLRVSQVVGHADVSPGRKSDPWAHWNWELFRGLLKARGVPE